MNADTLDNSERAVALVHRLRNQGYDVAAVQVGDSRIEVRGWRAPEAPDNTAPTDTTAPRPDGGFGLAFPKRDRG